MATLAPSKLSAAFAESFALASGARIDDDRTIAGVHFRLSFAGEGIRELLLPALAGASTAHAAPDFTLHIWDSTALPFSWRAEVASGRGEADETRTIRTSVTDGSGAVSVLDLEQRRGYFWIPDAQTLPWYERAAPFRTLFHWSLSTFNSHLMHAAAVSTKAGGVLLAGRGGSGKSTTALLCVAAGFAYAGDDYVAMKGQIAHTLYRSAKVDATSLNMLPPFSLAIAPNGLEKGVAILEDVAASLPIVALVVPRVTGGTSRIARTSAAQALRALAPTTLFQLRGDSASELAVMAALARSLPSWSLDLGDDHAAIPELVAHAIEASP